MLKSVCALRRDALRAVWLALTAGCLLLVPSAAGQTQVLTPVRAVSAAELGVMFEPSSSVNSRSLSDATESSSRQATSTHSARRVQAVE